MLMQWYSVIGDFRGSEGRVLAVIGANQPDAAPGAGMSLPAGPDATVAGYLTSHKQRVILEAALGSERFLEKLEDVPLPRFSSAPQRRQ